MAHNVNHFVTTPLLLGKIKRNHNHNSYIITTYQNNRIFFYSELTWTWNIWYNISTVVTEKTETYIGSLYDQNKSAEQITISLYNRKSNMPPSLKHCTMLHLWQCQIQDINVFTNHQWIYSRGWNFQLYQIIWYRRQLYWHYKHRELLTGVLILN